MELNDEDLRRSIIFSPPIVLACITPRPSGRIRFFVSRNYISASQPKNGLLVVIWRKNDANETKKKENVGLLLSSVIAIKKKSNRQKN